MTLSSTYLRVLWHFLSIHLQCGSHASLWMPNWSFLSVCVHCMKYVAFQSFAGAIS